jgi:hypothetical protein
VEWADAATGGPITFPYAVDRGGGVVSAPRVQPIVFAGDPLASAIDAFNRTLGESSYWRDSAEEYLVGPLQYADTTTLQEVPGARLSDDEIQGLLLRSLPQPDPNTLYAVYLPEDTIVTFDGVDSCTGFAGYHSELSVMGTRIGYAVLPRCPGEAPAIDALSAAASHEYFEWATNPFPFTDPSYSAVDDDHWVWGALTGAELTDLCAGLAPEPSVPGDLGFAVQAQWSNRSALGGHFPCLPGRPGPYVAAVPEQPDRWDVSNGAGRVDSTTRALVMSPGETRTVRVELHADAALEEPVALQAGPHPRMTSGGFRYALDRESMSLGSVALLTITAQAAGRMDVFVVVATYQGARTAWPALVVTR